MSFSSVNEKRNNIMPINKAYSISEIIKAVKYYIEGELIPEMEELEPDEEIYFETWY